ncbi:MAG: hypothetical protein WCJ56_04610 [bacterium]
MAKLTLEEKLAAVNQLARGPVDDDTVRGLRAGLHDASNMVMARATEIIGERLIDAIIPELIAVFTSLIQSRQPVSADKLCRAKEALVLALDALHNIDVDPYLLGLNYIQMEPVYGGKADTAGIVRANCATALSRLHYHELALVLAPMLFDAEVQPRIAAVKALKYAGGEAAEVALHVKIHAGDTAPEVIGEAFIALLDIDPERELPFVTECLNGGDTERTEQAALALGTARLPESFAILQKFWASNTDLELRKPLLLAIALTRSDEAFSYLLNILAEESLTTALHTLDALAIIYGPEKTRRERIAETIKKRHTPRLADAFMGYFPLG